MNDKTNEQNVHGPETKSFPLSAPWIERISAGGLVQASLPKFKLTLVRLEPEPGRQPEPVSAATRQPWGQRRPDGLVYVLHTSGTTGFPKIVRVPHKCILPNILHLRSLFQMSEDDVVLLASPLTFDPAVVDVFLALSSGAQLLVIPTAVEKTPSRLAGLLFRVNRTAVLQASDLGLGT
ncbi:beta-alanine-activating enzyme-like [Clinocottus analis]|uniref:beta-alanine-activating enzyme-like n=1 Tax=Clinocottus analis TaxID=304258 RepID=UPI0035BFE18F